MIKVKLISDIISRVTQGKPSDDLELEPAQVAFWLTIYGNELIQEYLIKNIENNKSIDDFFIVKEPARYFNTEAEPELTINRIFVRLTKPVLDLPNDRGIIRVRTDSNQIVYKTNVGDLDVIKTLEWSAPSTSTLVYYREGPDKLVIEGLASEDVDTTEIFVWYVPKLDVECLDDFEEVPVPDELLPTLQELVEARAQRELYGSNIDEENDGKQGLNG